MRQTHGMYLTRVYRIWQGMKSRCYDPKRDAFKNYGGRSIRVCEAWHKFEAFYRDMGDPPKGATLERKDNNKDYSPDNCGWVSREAQANNRRDNRLVTFNNETLTVMQWVKRTGLSRSTLYNRLDNPRWSIERALTKPSQRKEAQRRSKENYGSLCQ